MPEVGQEYSREWIKNTYGGSLQTFLPHQNGRVVAACIREEQNPQAPNKIFVSVGPGRVGAALMSTRQDKPFPVFIKRQGRDVYEYVGDRRAVRYEPLREPREAVPGGEKVQGVLFCEEA